MAANPTDRRITSSSADRYPGGSGTLLWAIYGVLAFLLVGYLASLFLRRDNQFWPWLDGWIVCGVELIASALCVARGCIRRPGRAAALILGLALLSWTIGDIVLTVESLGGATPPSPSLADAFYLCFYPLAYVAVMLFIRGEVRRITTSNWLDGAIAGLGAGAVCAAFAFHDILRSTGGNPAATVTNLAYPIGDVLLLGLVVGGFAVLSRRSKTPWILLAIGLFLNILGDTINLFQSSLGATRVGSILNAIAWPTAIVVMSMSVWIRQRVSNPLLSQRPAGFVLPNLSAAAALVILFVASFHSVGRIANALATATLVAVGIRLALTVHSITDLSQERHRQSVTDELTGLRNRRYLFRVLDEFFAECDASLTPRRP